MKTIGEQFVDALSVYIFNTRRYQEETNAAKGFRDVNKLIEIAACVDGAATEMADTLNLISNGTPTPRNCEAHGEFYEKLRATIPDDYGIVVAMVENYVTEKSGSAWGRGYREGLNEGRKYVQKVDGGRP